MKLEELEKPINIIATIAKLSLQLGISIGVLVVVVYCGIIGYYPTGVTLGDGLLFIAVCLAFSFSYSLVVIGLFSAGITLSPALRYIQVFVLFFANKLNQLRGKKNITSVINFPCLEWKNLGTVLLGLAVIFIIALSLINNFELGLGLLFSTILMGVIYGLWNTKPKADVYDKTVHKKVKLALLIAIILIPIIISKSQENILNQAMSLIGIRVQSTKVFITEKYSKFLQANGVKSEGEVTSHGAMYEATILFNGIGTNTVIETDGMKLILPTKEIIIGTKETLKNGSKRRP